MTAQGGSFPSNSLDLGQPMEFVARAPAYSRLVHSLSRNKLAAGGIVIIVLVVLTAVCAPWLAPQDPTKLALRERLLPPAWMEKSMPEHLLGTDSLGRDSLSRLIYGSRISLIVGLVSVVISGFLGVGLGLISGYYGGRIDDVIMRIADIQLAIPFITLAIAVMAVLGSGLRNIILVLGVTGWVSYARLVRGQVIGLREMEFVKAAVAVGAKNSYIIVRHILPNVVAHVIVIASFGVASNIISESSLSFLGLGVEPSIPSWGGMLADGRKYIEIAWWQATFPGLAILLTVMGINVVGDWLRDYLDPRLKHLD